MVKNQIANLTCCPSFGHNLCFKYSNGWYKPISDMSVPRNFQWCKELFNWMNFDPWNYFLKIWKSIRTPTPKVGAHLGVCGFIPSHPPTLSGAWNVSLACHGCNYNYKFHVPVIMTIIHALLKFLGFTIVVCN